MSSLNECKFIGNLGKDPEMRYTNGGKPVCSFSIACSESWKDKNTGQKVEHTEWVDIVGFDKLAEIMGEYLKKGSKVYISGKMKKDKYEKDGQVRYSTKIVAKDMIMLDSRPEGDKPQSEFSQQNQPPQGSSQGQQTAGPANQLDDFSDDVPFMSYEFKSIV